MRAIALGLLVALAGVLVSEPAEAHGRSRVSIGVGFGFGYPYWGPPYWGPWWYAPPPPYYYPTYYYPTVVVPAQPTTYIEQGSAPVADQGGWWYYCDSSRGYYPYVKECPGGWQRVPPAPPPAR